MYTYIIYRGLFSCLALRGSPVWGIPGSRSDRLLHDACHGQLLGTGKAANGSCLVYLCERSAFSRWPLGGEYKLQLAGTLRSAYTCFRSWCKTHGLQCTQPRFTPSRVNRAVRSSFPSLNSKAAPSKMLTMWLTDVATAWADKPTSTALDREVAVCIHSYAQALRVMDTEPLLMSAESAQAYCDHVLLHLQTYAYLHTQSFNTAGSVPNRANWQLLPKHHFFFHSALDVLEAGINPRMYSLLCGESFIGVLGRISKGCHRSNVSLRSIQRYLSCLHFKLQELSSRQLG